MPGRAVTAGGYAVPTAVALPSPQVGAQSFDSLEDNSVVRHSIEAITPDISRLNLFSLNPQDFTEVSGDLGIRKPDALASGRLGLGILPVCNTPSQTIEDRRIARRQRHPSRSSRRPLHIAGVMVRCNPRR